MVPYPIVVQQQTATPSPDQVRPDAAELRQQIRQSILDAQRAARDAAREVRIQDGHNGVTIVRTGPAMPAMPAMPGAAGTTMPSEMNDVIPPQAVDIAIGFFVMCAVMVIGWPISRSLGRRLERRGEQSAVGPALAEQLQRIEQAVEAMSIEVERISESQRFMAKLQGAASDRGVMPAGERR
jgi:hypothetical protein